MSGTLTDRADSGSGRGSGGDSARVPKNLRRIDAILADLPKHRDALDAAMAEFGQDFDLEALQAAAASEDPVDRNKVAVVERDFEVLQNYLLELAERGLSEARRTGREAGTTGADPFERMAEIGMIPETAARRLIDLQGTRNVIQHGYPVAVPALHESVNALRTELGPFVERFSAWLDEG